MFLLIFDETFVLVSRILLEDRESVSASKREEEEAEMDRSACVNLAMDYLWFSVGEIVGVRLPMFRPRAFAMPHRLGCLLIAYWLYPNALS